MKSLPSLLLVLNERSSRWLEIAKMAGVSYTTVARTARGESTPLATTCERIRVAAVMLRKDK